MATRIVGADSRLIRVMRWAMLPAFFGLCVYYNLVMPPFEGVDEASHYRYADYIATHWTLPDLRPEAMPTHEMGQTPLYYVAAAVAMAPVQRGDFATAYRPNPELGVVNIATVHDNRDWSFPPAGAVLALRLGRLVNSAFGCVTLILVYLVARRLTWSAPVATLAAALLAFNPKFISLSSLMTNDVAVAAGSAAVLWLCVSIMQSDRLIRPVASFALGTLVGLAMLFKMSGVAMAAPAVFALAWNLWRHLRVEPRTLWMRSVFVTGAGAFLGFAVTGGLFLLYQWLRYGDPLAWREFGPLHLGSRCVAPFTADQLFGMTPDLLSSAWGVFGWGTGYTLPVDLVYSTLFAIAAAGLMVAAARKRLPAESAVLFVSIAATLLAFAFWARSYGATNNSRLILAAFVPATVLGAIGLTAWLPRAVREVSAGLTGLTFAWACIAPLYSLIPSYWPPTPVSDIELAALPGQTTTHFENNISLVHAELASNRVNLGEPVRLRLYWRVDGEVSDNYRLMVQMVGDRDAQLLRVDTPPLGGRLLTSRWKPGAVYRDDYVLTAKTEGRTIGRVLVGWYLARDNTSPVRVKGEDRVGVQVAEIKLRGPAATPTESQLRPSPLAEFGGLVSLRRVSRDGDALTLTWQALQNAQRSMTAFVHGYDADGNLMAQADRPFDYSPVLWDTGEVFTQTYHADGISRAVNVGIGIYDSATQGRFKARRADGTVWQDSVALIESN